MSLSDLCRSFLWARYSKKLERKIAHPKYAGIFRKSESEERGMFLAIGEAGQISNAHIVWFYFLVDPQEGTIVDARFQVFGHSALIGAAEVACEVVVGKNYDQARRISADLIDQQVRDRGGREGFPEESAPHLNLVLEAIEDAALQCTHIPLPETYIAPPVSFREVERVEGGYPGWNALPPEQKIRVIESLLQQEIQPYIELDAGGVKVKRFESNQLIISYEGSCTSCHSATGATLSYIQHVIQAKISPHIEVIPDLEALTL